MKKRSKSEKSVSNIERVSILQKPKDLKDKFFDLIKENLRSVNIEKNENKKPRWILKGSSNLAKKLGVTVSKLKRVKSTGKLDSKKDKKLISSIKKEFTKLKAKKKKEGVKDFDTKKTTKEFNIHTFTFNNFFKQKVFKRKLYKNEQYFMRCGLHIVFQNNAMTNGEYIISNLPLSLHSSKHPADYKLFFDFIKYSLIEYPSLKFFRFNYFDVTRYKLDAIEKTEVKRKATALQAFKSKYDKVNKVTAAKKLKNKK